MPVSICSGCHTFYCPVRRQYVRPLLSVSYRYNKVSVLCYPTSWRISGWIYYKDSFLSVQKVARRTGVGDSFSGSHLQWCCLPATDILHADRLRTHNPIPPPSPDVLFSPETGSIHPCPDLLPEWGGRDMRLPYRLYPVQLSDLSENAGRETF